MEKQAIFINERTQQQKEINYSLKLIYKFSYKENRNDVWNFLKSNSKIQMEQKCTIITMSLKEMRNKKQVRL